MVDFQLLDTQGGDREQQAEQQARLAEDPSLVEGAGAAWRSESITRNLVTHTFGQKFEPDVNWVAKEEWMRQEFTKRNIPEEYSRHLADSVSEGHALHILDRIQEEMKDEQTLGRLGWGGVGMRMAASLVDPVQLVANVATGGVAGTFHKAARLKGFIAGGLAAGSTNAATEAWLGAQQYTREPDDIIAAGLLGFAIGGPIGSLTAREMSHLGRVGSDGYTAASLHRINKDGMLTPAGAEKLNGIEGEWQQAGTSVVVRKEQPALERPVIEGEGFRVGEEVNIRTEQAQISGTIEEVLPNGDLRVTDADGKTYRFKDNPMDQTDPDEGVFGADSVGAARRGGVVEEAVDTFATHLKIGRFKIPLRFDYYARFQNSENPVIRALGERLLYDNVGSKSGAVQGLNASEEGALMLQKYRGKFYSVVDDAWEEHARGQSWTTRMSFTEKNKFMREVTRAVRSGADSDNPAVQKVAAEIRKSHKELLEEMKKAGVQGADQVITDPAYMMRRFQHDNIAEMVVKHGEKNVRGMIQGAIMRARPDMDVEKADRVAKVYLKKVRGMRYDGQLAKGFHSEIDLAGIRTELKASIRDPDELEEVMDLLYQNRAWKLAEQGGHPRMKHRTLLDETYEHSYLDANGQRQTIRMDDMFENDARVLMDIYTRQTTGLIGLAKVGIKSEADFKALLDQARDWAVENADKIGKYDHNQMVKEAGDIYNYIVGRPMSTNPGSKSERIARILRDFNFIRMMGQAGVAQLAEIGNTLGLAGMRNLYKGMPAFRELFKLAKLGQLDDQLAKDLRNIGGFGTEIMQNHAFLRDLDEFDDLKGYTRMEDIARKGAQVVSNISGMNSINNILKNVAARAFLQRFAEYADQVAKLGVDDLGRSRFAMKNPKVMKMIAGDGMGEHEFQTMLEDLGRFTRRERNGKVQAIDYEAWQADSPESYEQFRRAMFRQVRRAVQEHTIGETAPWMHTGVGKLLTQFRSFALVAWNKQLLYGINHMNGDIATAWLGSMLFGGAAYVGQTHLNFAGKQEELDKRLTLSAVATSAFQRAGFSSLIPGIYDTVGGTFFNHNLFKYGRTTGLDTGFITGNPTVDLVFNKISGTLSAGAQTFLTDDHVWTKKDIRNALGLIPNTYLVRNFVNAMSEDAPSRNFLRINE